DGVVLFCAVRAGAGRGEVYGARAGAGASEPGSFFGEWISCGRRASAECSDGEGLSRGRSWVQRRGVAAGAGDVRGVDRRHGGDGSDGEGAADACGVYAAGWRLGQQLGDTELQVELVGQQN